MQLRELRALSVSLITLLNQLISQRQLPDYIMVADDFGGTLIGEEVVSCTGARSTELTDKRIVDSIHQMGYSVIERDNFYKTIRSR